VAVDRQDDLLRRDVTARRLHLPAGSLTQKPRNGTLLKNAHAGLSQSADKAANIARRLQHDRARRKET